jgi:hypothetical protein
MWRLWRLALMKSAREGLIMLSAWIRPITQKARFAPDLPVRHHVV